MYSVLSKTGNFCIQLEKSQILLIISTDRYSLVIKHIIDRKMFTRKRRLRAECTTSETIERKVLKSELTIDAENLSNRTG